MSNKANMTPPPDELRDLLYYDDGNLYWTEEARKQDKRRRVEPIGHNNKNGYKQFISRIGNNGVNRHYLLHRLIYWFKTGIWPELIDHIDRDKHNNHIENLREATKSENSRNRKSSGACSYLGVYFNKKDGMYRAVINVGGVAKNVYGYKTAEAAALARDFLAYYFHGEFASFNLLDKPLLIDGKRF